MHYQLNRSHSFNPKTHQNVIAVRRIEEYLANGKVASYEELCDVLAGLDNPHGCFVKWLARKSRKVLLPVIEPVQVRTLEAEIKEHEEVAQSESPLLSMQEDSVWENPRAIDLNLPLIYRIEITAPDSKVYHYIGKARNGARLREYDRNMKKIAAGKDRGKVQGYRAVHFALYIAIQSGWDFQCFPLENTLKETLGERESELIAEFTCNLNNGRSWRIVDMPTLSIDDLIDD